MIISGEHNGPLEPDNKQVGAIICAEDSVAFDSCVCSLMGFKPDAIPMLRNINAIKEYPIIYNDNRNIYLTSNIESLDGESLSTVSFPKQWKFIPCDGWGSITK